MHYFFCLAASCLHKYLFLLLSSWVISDSLLGHGCSTRGFLSISVSQSLLNLMSIELVMLSSHLILFCPFLPLQSFPESGSFLMIWLFASGGQIIGASASALVHPVNMQDWFPLWLTVWSPCNSLNSQDSFPIPQFKSINSLLLNHLYGPTLTSVHDYWKNHIFD